jgi:hypothetical protein
VFLPLGRAVELALAGEALDAPSALALILAQRKFQAACGSPYSAHPSIRPSRSCKT